MMKEGRFELLMRLGSNPRSAREIVEVEFLEMEMKTFKKDQAAEALLT